MEELEKCITLLNRYNAPIWRIDGKDGRKRGEYKGENLQESTEQLNEVFHLLSNGNYTLIYRSTSTNEKGQSYHDFSIKNQAQMYGQQQPQPQQYAPQQSAGFTEFLAFVKDFAELKTQVKYMERDINEIRKQLKDVVEDLTDSDTSNDKGAIEKLTEIANAVPSFAGAFKSFKA